MNRRRFVAIPLALLIGLVYTLTSCPFFPGTTSDIELKKRIVRTLIREIIIRVEGAMVNAVVHWEGGDHTRLVMPRKQDRRPPLEDRCRD